MPIKKKTRHQTNGKKLPNAVFLLPPQPQPGDNRPRNAFGYLLSFGKAYAEYYRRQDEARANKAQTEERSEFNETPPCAEKVLD